MENCTLTITTLAIKTVLSTHASLDQIVSLISRGSIQKNGRETIGMYKRSITLSPAPRRAVMAVE